MKSLKDINSIEEWRFIPGYCRGYYVNYSTGKKVNVNHAGGYKWKYK